MAAERHVKLFRNGRNRAVRIPREFDFPGDEAVMRQEGEGILILPIRRKSLSEVLATLSAIEEDFAPIEDLPPEPVEL